jgi:hypothetical protein
LGQTEGAALRRDSDKPLRRKAAPTTIQTEASFGVSDPPQMKPTAARIKQAALKALARGESLNQFVAEATASV